MLSQLIMVLLTMFGSDVTPNQNFELKCYPEKLQIGDTFYVMVVYHNNMDEDVFFPSSSLNCMVEGQNKIGKFAFFNDQGKKWFQFMEEDFKCYFTCLVPDFTIIECLPHSNTCLFITSFTLPPLEDLYQSDFWNEVSGMENGGSKVYPLDFEIEMYSFEDETLDRIVEYRQKRFTLQQKVVLTRRLEQENILLKQWYENTPKEYYPKLARDKSYYIKRTPHDITQVPEGYHRQKIMNHDFKYFIRTGNRYPGDPNAPETWQGWKELEDSLTSSTMKDEIRLTRIIIQYCDTGDEKVLDELKEWFDGMNEIQRVCMVKSIFDRMNLCGELMAPEEAKSLIPFYQDLYNSIHEYDITAKPERVFELKKRHGLIE